MRNITASAVIIAVLALSACGGGDNASSDSPPDDAASPNIDVEPDADVQTTDQDTESVEEQPAATTDSTGDGAPSSAATAVVTFEDDGTTREFALDECFTSFTSPGNFVESNDDLGSFSSHGTDADGWVLQLSVLPNASGEATNFSFLTDSVDSDYQLGNLEYEMNENVVTASATSDIYQTFDEEESIPLSFVLTC